MTAEALLDAAILAAVGAASSKSPVAAWTVQHTPEVREAAMRLLGYQRETRLIALQVDALISRHVHGLAAAGRVWLSGVVLGRVEEPKLNPGVSTHGPTPALSTPA